MLFEIYENRRRLFVTEHENCIPTAEEIESHLECKHEVLLDGKPYKKEARKTKKEASA